MEQPLLTVCVPCFGRPDRTKRLVSQILEQDMEDWEAFIIGDGCPQFQRLIDDGFFEYVRLKLKDKKSRLIVSNMPIRSGGWGFHIRNTVRELANGKYMIFIDNDDMIKLNHFSSYVGAINNSNNDMVYFDSFIVPTKSLRITSLDYGRIGHAEIIIKTELAKKLPPQSAGYGHDWEFIKSAISAGAKIVKSSNEPTYLVCGLGDLRELNID